MANGSDLDRDGLADRLAKIDWMVPQVSTK
jgi:hypothetical protein